MSKMHQLIREDKSRAVTFFSFGFQNGDVQTNTAKVERSLDQICACADLRLFKLRSRNKSEAFLALLWPINSLRFSLLSGTFMQLFTV